MLINKVKIKIFSGDGGNSKISFINKNKKNIFNGGNGGNGGNIILKVDHKINNLNNFIRNKIFTSERGFDGKNNFRNGKNGKNLIIKIPEGTLVRNINNKIIFNLYSKFKKNIVLKGGKGGRFFKNFKYKYNDIKSNLGGKGLKDELELEYNILSHITLLGLPNSGKSSLINILTNTNSYINNYIFTTLYALKGVLNINLKKKIFILDLPGFIKNSFNGFGLGLFFLKYTKYTKILFYLIDLFSFLINNIFIINNEYYKYNKYYFYKSKIFIFNKFDLKICYFNKFYIKKILLSYNFFYYKIFISSKKKIYYKEILNILYKSIFNDNGY